jgi:hypothetical protein
MKKHKCPCCGYHTLKAKGKYDICPVCFWEDDPRLNARMKHGWVPIG